MRQAIREIRRKKAHAETAAELGRAIRALQRNNAAFQFATDGLMIEQLVYEHAALMCRCRALIRELRTLSGGDALCRSA